MAKSPPAGDTRDRIVVATAELFRRQGFNATALSQVVKASGATTGSLYHFFPDGKEELAAVVFRSTGAAYRELVELVITAASDPASAMTDTFASAAMVMVETEFIDPCPIGTIAKEIANTHDHLRQVALEVMETWVVTVQDYFAAAGIPQGRARDLATMAVASIEGAFLLSRVNRDVSAMMTVGEMMSSLVAVELAKIS